MSAEVVDFWHTMMNHFSTKNVHKGDSSFIGAVGWTLDLMGIQNKQKFMESTSTTIGKTIYTPFRIGDGSKIPLWQQMVACVHEHQHVIQGRETGYEFNYLLYSSKRARYEAEAYRCNLEMLHWKYGKVQQGDVNILASALSGYGCSKNDVDFARSFLEASLPTISKGGVISEAMSVARNQWLDSHGKEFRA